MDAGAAHRPIKAESAARHPSVFRSASTVLHSIAPYSTHVTRRYAWVKETDAHPSGVNFVRPRGLELYYITQSTKTRRARCRQCSCNFIYSRKRKFCRNRGGTLPALFTCSSTRPKFAVLMRFNLERNQCSSPDRH